MFHVKHLQASLDAYKNLLELYHPALDLMSEEAIATVDKKIGDGLEYAKLIEAQLGAPGQIVDVGSGAGLPAIPLAVALPETQIHVVERRSKRATFLRLVKSQLALANLTVHATDVTRVRLNKVPIVTALAFGSLLQIYCLTRHMHAPTVTIVSRKGANWGAEVAELEKSLNPKTPPETQSVPLANNGTLVALRLPGGLVCPS